MSNKIKVIFKGIYKWIPTLKENTNVVIRDENTQAHLTSKGGYLGFDESIGSYLRTPVNGLIPNVNGYIGTSGWRFAVAYFKDLDISNSVTTASITSKNWITSNNGIECYGGFYGHGSCWLRSQYASGGNIHFGTGGSYASIDTSDERYEKFFMDLNPVHHKWINFNEEDQHDRKHGAFIKQALYHNDLTEMDFSFYCYDDVSKNKNLPYDDLHSLTYTEMIPLNTHMIQKLYKVIDQQQKQIDELKKQIDLLNIGKSS